MDTILQQIINGISIGSVYALIAVGYSLVYSILKFSNFAHGGVLMLGSYMGFFALTLLGIPFWLALPLAMIGAGLLGIINERLAYRPIRIRNSPLLYLMISSLGASIFLENITIDPETHNPVGKSAVIMTIKDGAFEYYTVVEPME